MLLIRFTDGRQNLLTGCLSQVSSFNPRLTIWDRRKTLTDLGLSVFSLFSNVKVRFVRLKAFLSSIFRLWPFLNVTPLWRLPLVTCKGSASCNLPLEGKICGVNFLVVATFLTGTSLGSLLLNKCFVF